MNTYHYGHWLPLITCCPVKKRLDIGYVTIHSTRPLEIFRLRKLILSYSFMTFFIEDILNHLKKTIKLSLGLDVAVSYHQLFGKVDVHLVEPVAPEPYIPTKNKGGKK